MLITSLRDGQLLLDCQCRCQYRVPLAEATFETRLGEVLVTDDDLIVGQVQILLRENQRVVLTENRAMQRGRV